MRLSLRSTLTRTFLVLPAAVPVVQALSGRRVRCSWVPLFAAGYLAYRLSGNYGYAGPAARPGMTQGMPLRLVVDGPYAWTRNPMYLGHLVFMAPEGR